MALGWQLQPSEGYTIVFFILLYAFILKFKPRKKLPPGPTKWPIIGNFLNIPKSYAWEVYASWSKKYESDILHLETLGTSMIILNSYKSAKEILDKRCTNSRPKSVMLTDLSGFGTQFGMMPYGEPWRVRRSLFKQYFKVSNAHIYQMPEAKYIHRLLVSLAERPADFSAHIRQMTGSVSISMTYGVDVHPTNDQNLHIARLASAVISTCLTTGSSSVDLFPLLKHLPAWVPGTSFHATAKVARQHAKHLRERTYSEGRNKMVNKGVDQDSFLSLSLRDLDFETDSEAIEIIKDVGANIYMAAANTTASILEVFILAMTSFPEIQKKAREELDRVLHGRLPTHADITLLPYLSAVIKEGIRWRPIVPLGTPHLVDEDTSYNGYFIGAKSIIIYNLWAMLHDEKEYPDPESFKPERYMNDGKAHNNGLNPAEIIFGFGRRVCPGSHIGLSNIHLSAASILTLFNIDQILDENGRPIKFSCSVKPSGTVIAPPPFPCSITPRSEEASRSIKLLALEDI